MPFGIEMSWWMLLTVIVTVVPSFIILMKTDSTGYYFGTAMVLGSIMIIPALVEVTLQTDLKETVCIEKGFEKNYVDTDGNYVECKKFENGQRITEWVRWNYE